MKKPTLTLWLALAAVCCSAADIQVYNVRKNDTLSEIAQQFGVTVPDLMRFNRLERADKIYAGQSLEIPRVAARLPDELRQKLNVIQVTPRKWKNIVLHHSATDNGTVQAMDRYHRMERHMENGLAYHFVIGNGQGIEDGAIALGRRWLEQLDGGHLASDSLNARSIGICLVGNFDKKKPTEKQMESVRALIEYLLQRCSLQLSAVKTHQKINTIHTRCPGKHFPFSTLQKELKSRSQLASNQKSKK